MAPQFTCRLAVLSVSVCTVLSLAACGGADEGSLHAGAPSASGMEVAALESNAQRDVMPMPGSADAEEDAEAAEDAAADVLAGITGDELHLTSLDASTQLPAHNGGLSSVLDAAPPREVSSVAASPAEDVAGAGTREKRAGVSAGELVTVQGPQDSPGPMSASAWLTGFDSGESLRLMPSGQALRFENLQVLKSPSNAIDMRWLSIQLQGGDGSERQARLVVDPQDPSNKLLRFWLRSANVRDAHGVPYKGRVQFNAYTAAEGAREVRFSARMFITPDMNLLRNMRNSFSWLVVSEWWNNASWDGEKYPFRITVNIAKPSTAAGSPLNFSVVAQSQDVQSGLWPSIQWRATNTQVSVPVGQWVTLEYFFREGNSSRGRFYMAMVPDGGQRQVLFDVTGWTHHPADPAPDGIKHINPMKLYTSKTLIDNVRKAGGVLQIYWDDINFQLCPISCSVPM